MKNGYPILWFPLLLIALALLGVGWLVWLIIRGG